MHVLAVIGATDEKCWPLLLGKDARGPAAFPYFVESFIKCTTKGTAAVFEPNVSYDFHQCGTTKRELCAFLAREIDVVMLNTQQFGKLFGDGDRKSTRLNSSHLVISYAVF